MRSFNYMRVFISGDAVPLEFAGQFYKIDDQFLTVQDHTHRSRCKEISMFPLQNVTAIRFTDY